MNLHIINDEKFFDPFVEKMESLNLLSNNRFVVKECGPLKFIKRKDLVFGRMCDDGVIGNTFQYDKVFIHYFSFEMYRWVHQHTFKELNWMIWGKELYESELVNFPLYEPLTKSMVKKTKDQKLALALYYKRAENFLMNIDVEKIYGKINNVLTWIEPEYKFAINHIRGLKARHQEFAYMFEYDAETIPYNLKNEYIIKHKPSSALRCILGNSGATTNNHLDALYKIKKANLGEVLIPVSYGNARYVELLKKEVEKRFPLTDIHFLNEYMSFETYMRLFNEYDVFISNSIRPVGMGNVWMALLMGKIVFMNKTNLVFSYLQSFGLQIFSIEEIDKIADIISCVNLDRNRSIALKFLSKDRINGLYTKLFDDKVCVN